MSQRSSAVFEAVLHSTSEKQALKKVKRLQKSDVADINRAATEASTQRPAHGLVTAESTYQVKQILPQGP